MIVGIAVASMAVIFRRSVSGTLTDDMPDNKVPLAMMGGQVSSTALGISSPKTTTGDMVSWTYLSGVDGTDSMFNLIGYDEAAHCLQLKQSPALPWNTAGSI